MRVVLLMPVLMLAGCATVTRGSTEMVDFSSDPPGAIVQTSIGLACPTTPCKMEISRKTDFVATFTKPGYLPQSIPVGTAVEGGGAAGFAGNILLGGVVGMAADVATGATLNHVPNPVHANLLPEPAAPEPAPAPALPRRGAKKPIS